MRHRRVVLLLLVLGAAICLWQFASNRTALLASIRNSGPWSPLIYVLGFTVLAVAFVPAGLLTMLGGALFGTLAGTGLAFISATLAACSAFLIARYVARGSVDAWISSSPRLARVVNCVARDGRKVVCLLRLAPVIPFSLVNVSAGVSGMRLRDFAFACVAMLPTLLLYGYYGAVLGEVVALNNAHRTADPAHYAMLAVGLAATLTVTVIVSRIAQRELRLSGDASLTSQRIV